MVGSLLFLGQSVPAAASGGVQLDPGFTIKMDLPLDCESAALAAALTIRGINVNTGGIPLQNWVFNSLPKDGRASYVKNGVRYWGDAFEAFVGSVYGSEANFTGYGVYYAPIAAIAQEAGATVGLAGTGYSTQQIEAQILDGNPVVIWVDTRSLSGGGTAYPASSYTAFDGRTIPYSAYDHAIVVVGADPGHNLTILEDHSGNRYTYTETQFTRIISSFHGMAVAVGPPLRVNSVSPNSGLTAGGETVMVHGIGFGSGLTARIGSTKVTPFAVTATSFSFIAPARPVGSAAVQVSRSGVSSPLSAADTYAYYGPAVVTALSPGAGPSTGGQVVTANGYGFIPGMTATFGGTPVTPMSQTLDSFSFTTPAEPAGYDQLVVTTSLGVSTPTASAGYLYTGLGSYVPLTPYRILDTRSGLCGVNRCHSLGAGETLALQVTGYTDAHTGESVASDAAAVVLNVLAVDGSSSSLLSVYPNGIARPLAASLNFPAHVNVANLVTVALGQNGASDTQREVNIYNALGSVNVLADVEGYFAPQSASNPAGEFHAIAPLRVCDTRADQSANGCNQGHSTDNKLGQGHVVKVTVSGVPRGVTGSPASIPDDGTAGAAVLNLTAIAGSQATFLSVFPTQSDGTCATSQPGSSTISVAAGAVEANRVIVPLGPSHTGGPSIDVCAYNAVGTINFTLDATGWFGSTSGSPAVGAQYQAIEPTRICDTRSGSGTECSGHQLTSRGTLLVAVAGVDGIPRSGPVAIIANLTAVSGSQGTYLTMYPADVSPRPNASDVNVIAGATLPNLVVVGMASGAHAGDVNLFNAVGGISAVLDVEGWFQ
jgi:uncharacterized protein YvpB